MIDFCSSQLDVELRIDMEFWQFTAFAVQKHRCIHERMQYEILVNQFINGDKKISKYGPLFTKR